MINIIGKLVLVGESDVGKTSVVARYVQGYFNSHVTSTIGAAYYTCTAEVDSTKIQLQIWDTSGEERFRAVAPLFYRKTQAVILVFDVTNPESFHKLPTWLKELEKHVTDYIPIFVIGNKCDCISTRQIFEDEALAYANGIGAVYFDTSALTGKGIAELFYSVAVKFRDISITPKHNLKIFDEEGVCKNDEVQLENVTHTKKQKLKKCC